MIRKTLAAFAACAAVATGAVACSSQPTTYTPVAAAWGNAGLSQCYMPLGVPQSAWQAIEQQYVASHYCQAGWSPIIMPTSTYWAYYPYWSSGAYYTHYVPSTYRTSYVTYEKSYGTQYASQIKTAERTATYKGSNGKTTTYNKISTGGGTRSKFGSGTRCDVVRDALLQPKYQRRGGTSHFGGGSRSGGGSRTGSGSRSRTGSGSTRTGC